MNNNIYKSLLFSCLAVMGVSCNQGANAPAANAKPLYDFSLTQADVDSYLQYKNIAESDKQKRERAVRSLIVRNALAETILQQQWSGQAKALSHVKDRRNQILINNYFEDYIQQQVTSESLKAYYEKNKAQFADKKLRLALILKKKPANAAKKQKILDQLSALVIQLRKPGADFTAAAKKHSDDKENAAKGGDLGWKAESDLERIVFNTAVRLPKGTVAGPLETKDGLVILKTLEEPAIQEREFDKVKDQVERQFRYALKLQETGRLNKLVDEKVRQEQNRFKIATR
ncbi:MAG: peptidylprolyl isomerase [Gammaproteobacteria bacterium]|nr:peptidylprolyl isomerase [Gammaproteobacteria bacterium]MDH5801163.1 peptidylprolyl isomerase [Gammaproteobacteria bacterium]